MLFHTETNSFCDNIRPPSIAFKPRGGSMGRNLGARSMHICSGKRQCAHFVKSAWRLTSTLVYTETNSFCDNIWLVEVRGALGVIILKEKTPRTPTGT